jgi:hypothetical protein
MKTLFGLLLLAATALAQINVQDFGAIPNDGVDDSPAFQLAVNQRRSVIIPKGVYRLSSTVLLPDEAGLRVIGEGCELVKLLPDTGVTTIQMGANWQSVENLSIHGTPLGFPGARSQIGVFIGPNSCSRFRLIRVHFSNLSIASDNRSPGAEPASYGSDAGGIRDCHYSYCWLGHHSFGNKDFTQISGTSFVDNDEAIRVDSGGGVSVREGVFASNRLHVHLVEGRGKFNSVWWEGVQENAHCYVDTGWQSHAEFVGGFLQTAGPTVPFLFAQHSTGIHLGSHRAFSVRVNGSADVRGDGQEVDYNGVFKRRAGNYRIIGADTNPPPLGANVPDVAKYLIAAFGAVPFDRFAICQQTGVFAGVPVFEWVDTLRREVLRNGAWVPL